MQRYKIKEKTRHRGAWNALNVGHRLKGECGCCVGVHDERLGLIEMEFRLVGLGLTGYSIRWGLIRIRDLDGF